MCKSTKTPEHSKVKLRVYTTNYTTCLVNPLVRSLGNNSIFTRLGSWVVNGIRQNDNNVEPKQIKEN